MTAAFPSRSLSLLALIAGALLAGSPTRASVATAVSGETVTFSVAVDGTSPFAYQWSKNSVSLAGATGATYQIGAAQLADAGNYGVIVSNAAGSTTSDVATLTVDAPPVFSVQPASQTVTAGGSVTFSAAATGTPAPSYQWQLNGVNLLNATGASFTIANVAPTDAGTYTVVASNVAGSATSNGAALMVNIPAVAPVFTTQPLTQTVTAGAPVAFTSVATGTPAPTYQWQKNGVNIAGATSASYSIGSTTTGDTGTYTVIATNSAGFATSNGAVLTVNPLVIAPVFTTQPLSQTVTAGTPVTFTAAATGAPAPAYEWRKNGGNIAGATGASYAIASVAAGDAGTYTVVATNTGGSVTSNAATLTVNVPPNFTTQPLSQTVTAGTSVTFTSVATGSPTPVYQWRKNGGNIAGATGPSYTITSVATTDAGTYTVVATNTAGSVTSSSATLTVNVPPAFTAQPLTQTVMVGAAVTFTAAATGSPAPTYQWRKSGGNIGGATGASYAIASVAAGDAGTYTVVATNTAGSATSNAATLTVNVPPSFTTQPLSQTVTSGTSVTFTSAATGSPAPTCQWQKNGANIAGATGASYTIASVATTDAGTYTAIATNSAGSATSSGAVLTVNAAATAPVFTVQPASQTVTVGAAVSFSAAATGTPTPTYQWRKNGATVLGATGASYTIASVATTDAGTYTVIATNSAGSATSSGAVLTVNAAATAPVFTVQPATQTVTVGATVTFGAAATGTPTPTYQWRKNGATVLGATGASYTIASVATTDAGTYTVIATNSAGSATSSGAVLTVNAAAKAPVFTVQPASQTVAAGSSVTFIAAASGSPTPTYQWKKNGRSISGATKPWYTIASVTTGNAGTYSVVAKNSVGSATSQGAVLTVTTSAPKFAVQPASWTVTAGASVTFTAAASGAPTPAYQWRKNGKKIYGANGATYTIATVTTSSAGTYSVVATNSVGSATSTGAALRVVSASSIITVDFNFDGHSDLLWQNRSTGECSIWLMNGTTETSVVSLGVISTDWTIGGIGDFNHDGNPDILWQNSATGEVSVWLMDGTAQATVVSLGSVSSDWSIAGTGNFNGDGQTDILWQNTVTGERTVWLMNGTTQTGAVSLGVASADWLIGGTGDFNGDGQTDILWQNTATGERTVWLMNGTTPITVVSLGVVSTDWSIAGSGEFDGSGQTDILWQNTVSGERSIWLMNSVAESSVISLGIVGPDWAIRN